MSEAITGAAALPRPRVRARILAAAGVAALSVASVSLFLVSRGKWSDAIIDSGREWIVPDALVRGDLLYRDVVYWFGPFTPYFHAAFFALFGSSFRTLVLAGVVGSIGILAALYFALTAVTGRRQAALWTALAIPALVFMPNAGGPVLGMGYRIWHAAAFALCAVTVAARPARRPTAAAVAAGALAALSGLCRTEWGLAALVAVVVVFAAGRSPRAGRAPSIAVAVSAFTLIFGGALAAFVQAAGWTAVVADGHVLLTGLPEETREFLVTFSGIRGWKTGIAQLLYSAAMWVGVAVLIDLVVSFDDPATVRRRLPVVLALFVVLGAAALAGGATGAVLFSAAPLVSLGGVLAGFLRRHRPAGAALLGLGLLGLVLSYRRPFHIGDSAYVGPPLLFAFVCAAGLLQLATERRRPRARRVRLRTGLAYGAVVLVTLAFAGRAIGYARDPRVSISGTEGMLSARPELAREIEDLAEAVRTRTVESDGLVAFPEGEILNYLSGRRNPIRHKLYIRGYLNPGNEDDVLRELERARPAAVAILGRRTGEYGASLFGTDYAADIGRWIARGYLAAFPESKPTPKHPTFELRVRRVGGR